MQFSVGMTGSGKTGLCIALLEEAAIDGIPSIIIDPKGDLSNLLLTFPDLKGEDFAAWVNEQDAKRKIFRSRILPPSRPNCGEKVWPAGARMAPASGG